MNYSELRDLSEPELIGVITKHPHFSVRTAAYYILNKSLSEEAILKSKEDPEGYLDSIEPYVNEINYTIFLPKESKILFAMIKLNFANGQYNKILLNEIFNTPSFNQFNKEEQDLIVENLIAKNQLKVTPEFLTHKLKNNILFAEISDNQVQYTFGLKQLDDKQLRALGSEFSDYQELGWVNNLGEISKFRTAFKEFLSKIQGQKILAIIREDNEWVIALVKRAGFKEIKKIKSPYSDNILVVFKIAD